MKCIKFLLELKARERIDLWNEPNHILVSLKVKGEKGRKEKGKKEERKKE